MKVVGEKLQKERKHFRMMYEGSRVDDEDTIESLDAYDGDIFEVQRSSAADESKLTVLLTGSLS